jgi:tripartite-type tricarboxylate transporter receptor subunit TctC
MTDRLDIMTEFKAVTKLSSWPLLLVVSGNSPYQTQAELIAAMKAQPGKLNYSSGGSGSPSHLAFEWLDARVPGGVKATHIPFKGNIDAVSAMMGGQVDFTFSLLPNVSEQIKAGKLRALSITSATRSSLHPHIPTVSDAGVTGYIFDAWGALMVPAGTPDSVITSIFDAVKASADSPDFKALIARGGGVVELSASPAAFTAQLRAALVEEKSVVERLRLKSP